MTPIPWRSPNPKVYWTHPLWVRPDCMDGDSLQSQIHEDEYGLRDLILPGEVVVDCGAYIGAVSALAASLGAFVYAVEPLESNAELWRLNTGSLGGCKLFQGALASHGEVVPILRLRQDEYGRRNRFVTMTAEMRAVEPEPCEYAKRIDINDVLEAAGAKIRLLKIDIEGAEWDVLPTIKPELLARVENIAMEIHAVPPPKPEDDIEAIRQACFQEARRLLPGFDMLRTKHNDIFLRR